MDGPSQKGHGWTFSTTCWSSRLRRTYAKQDEGLNKDLTRLTKRISPFIPEIKMLDPGGGRSPTGQLSLAGLLVVIGNDI